MNWILKLYPRTWRERYGEEIQEFISKEPRSARLWWDLFVGAIDARANPQLATSASAPEGGHASMRSFLQTCHESRSGGPTTGYLMIGASLVLVAAYFASVLAFGKHVLTDALLYSAFSVALFLSQPPAFLRGLRPASRVASIVFGIAGIYVFFLAVTLLAARI